MRRDGGRARTECLLGERLEIWRGLAARVVGVRRERAIVDDHVELRSAVAKLPAQFLLEPIAKPTSRLESLRQSVDIRAIDTVFPAILQSPYAVRMVEAVVAFQADENHTRPGRD